MGYVEMMEVIRRVSAIPIPDQCSMMFAMNLRGLTYDNFIVNAVGYDVNGRRVEAEWKIKSIPTGERLEEFTDKLQTLWAGRGVS